MELEGVKRFFFWCIYFAVVLLFGIFFSTSRISLIFRVFLVALVAFISARFRLEDKYSFLSLVLVLAAGLVLSIILANNSVGFWGFAFLYIVLFFVFSEVYDRKLLEFN